MNKKISMLICFLVVVSAIICVTARPPEDIADIPDEEKRRIPPTPEPPVPPIEETVVQSSGSSSRKVISMDSGVSAEQMEHIESRLDYIQAIAENPSRTDRELQIRAGILKACRVGETTKTEVGYCNCGMNVCVIVQ